MNSATIFIDADDGSILQMGTTFITPGIGEEIEIGLIPESDEGEIIKMPGVGEDEDKFDLPPEPEKIVCQVKRTMISGFIWRGRYIPIIWVQVKRIEEGSFVTDDHFQQFVDKLESDLTRAKLMNPGLDPFGHLN